MIIIPHGLAADVLRALQGTRRGTCGAIVDEIDRAHGIDYIDDGPPGVGFAPVWRQLRTMGRAGILAHMPTINGTLWSLRRG